MLEKEWITNDKGGLEAIWEQRDRVAPSKFDFSEKNSRSATDSLEPPADPLRKDDRISAALQALKAYRTPSLQFTPASSARGGNWNKLYTILKSVLP